MSLYLLAMFAAAVFGWQARALLPGKPASYPSAPASPGPYDWATDPGVNL